MSQFLSVPEVELYCEPINETKILCKRLVNGCQTPANAGKRQALNGRYTRFCVEGFSASPKRNKGSCWPERADSAYDTPYHKGGRAGVAGGESKKK